MAIYAVPMPKCRCGKNATFAIHRSGNEVYATACGGCKSKIGRQIAESIGEDWVD